jgi:hypothetical protein
LNTKKQMKRDEMVLFQHWKWKLKEKRINLYDKKYDTPNCFSGILTLSQLK